MQQHPDKVTFATVGRCNLGGELLARRGREPTHVP
jgi:hypothetical protein